MLFGNCVSNSCEAKVNEKTDIKKHLNFNKKYKFLGIKIMILNPNQIILHQLK